LDLVKIADESPHFDAEAVHAKYLEERTSD